MKLLLPIFALFWKIFFFFQNVYFLKGIKKDGLVTTDDSGYLELSKEGRAIAKKIYERHTVLTKMFMALGIDEKTASDDACRIEHYISDKTFKAIKSHMNKWLDSSK